MTADLGRLLDHLRAFLLELGAGFAFVGSQYHLGWMTTTPSSTSSSTTSGSGASW